MVYLIDCNVLSRRCRIILEECAEQAEPGFVASPALDGLAINRLPGLPLARRLHGTRIEFGAKAGVAPGKAAASDDPPDHRLRRTGQVLVIDLDEPIRRQHSPPMVGQPPVAPEIRDKFGAAGRKCQTRVEMGLVD